MSEASSKEQRYPCPSCHAGHVSLQHVAYFTWLSGELITVPEFPAWICDVCGQREYDQQALSWLNIILNPSAGRNRRHRQPPVHPLERPAIQPDL